jgi:competence protein ComGC
MDSEAISILWGYFENNYYNTSLSLEKMISNTFEETAESIMSKPTNGWDVVKVLIIIIAIIIVILVIYKIIKNKNSREKEREEYTKEILDKPLETFGIDTSELEKKYENNNQNNT